MCTVVQPKSSLCRNNVCSSESANVTSAKMSVWLHTCIGLGCLSGFYKPRRKGGGGGGTQGGGVEPLLMAQQQQNLQTQRRLQVLAHWSKHAHMLQAAAAARTMGEAAAAPNTLAPAAVRTVGEAAAAPSTQAPAAHDIRLDGLPLSYWVVPPTAPAARSGHHHLHQHQRTRMGSAAAGGRRHTLGQPPPEEQPLSPAWLSQ